jgi:hypothetical protein
MLMTTSIFVLPLTSSKITRVWIQSVEIKLLGTRARPRILRYKHIHTQIHRRYRWSMQQLLIWRTLYASVSNYGLCLQLSWPCLNKNWSFQQAITHLFIICNDDNDGSTYLFIYLFCTCILNRSFIISLSFIYYYYRWSFFFYIYFTWIILLARARVHIPVQSILTHSKTRMHHLCPAPVLDHTIYQLDRHILLSIISLFVLWWQMQPCVRISFSYVYPHKHKIIFHQFHHHKPPNSQRIHICLLVCSFTCSLVRLFIYSLIQRH